MALDYDPFNPQVQTSTLLQVGVALIFGLLAFLLFCVLRSKYPKIYVAKFTEFNHRNPHVIRKESLPKLPSSLFGWMPVLYRVSEDQVLANAGLDAAVFLQFFKFAIKTIVVCLVFAYTIILPIRYHFTGRFDDEKGLDKEKDPQLQYERLQWLYTVFTYVITLLVLYFLFKTTLKIIDMRQTYLGSQDAITDRTVKIQGIPPILREEGQLKQKVEALHIGKVDEILIVREWHDLNELFRLRRRILRQAEVYWVQYLKLCGIKSKTDLLSSNIEVEHGDNVGMMYRDLEAGEVSTQLLTLLPRPLILDHISEIAAPTTSENRPTFHKGWFGLFGPKVDAINYTLDQLRVVDAEINKARQREYPASLTAFVTMESVAQAQLLAQAVLDPKVNHLITSSAPAPHDIIWDNLCLTRKERNIRRTVVTFLIFFVSVVMLYLVVYLTKFLKLKLIQKVLPGLAEMIKAHPWAEIAITRILPPYVFTIFNVVVPYLFIWITEIQGYALHSDEELSSVAKNFFYNFVNLFLIFTLFGTVNLTDTGLIAKTLAEKLQELLVFYIHLTILLGIGLFPYKLLLVGNLFNYSLGSWFVCKTPRDYLRMYNPPNFNFGLQLPTPILVFIITILYSIMNLKILTAGLVYFICGFYVYKYQLLYACIHPPHSTGKVWIMIFRRIIIGLLLFQLTMAGMLGLRKAYVGATLIAPLPLYTVYCLFQFEKSYVPLVEYIALRAIDTPETSREQTVDERREQTEKYEFPNLVLPLNGPVIAVDYDEELVVQNDGQIVKQTR
ncbi:hypothetical protein JNB11_04820 [Kocuria palustris]|nr:hypothetical protein [Kocuria palustris]